MSKKEIAPLRHSILRDDHLNDRQSISIAVLTEKQDEVEIVNRTLRDAGHAAHCHWVDNPSKLDHTLEAESVELIVVNGDSYADSIRQVIEQKDAYRPESARHRHRPQGR
jgi:hypothetical protein